MSGADNPIRVLFGVQNMDNKILIAVIAVVAVVIVAAAAVVLLKDKDDDSFEGVIYDGNGGKTVAGESALKTNELAVKGNPFLRDGYDFVGWNTKADGSGSPYYEDDNVKSGTVLYAQWDGSLKFYVPLSKFVWLDHDAVELYIASGDDYTNMTKITTQGTYSLPSNAKIVYKGLGDYSAVSVSGQVITLGDAVGKITLTLDVEQGISAPFAVAGHSDLAACSITATSGTVTFNLLSIGN